MGLDNRVRPYGHWVQGKFEEIENYTFFGWLSSICNKRNLAWQVQPDVVS